jgi:hypothetical protein
MRAVGQAWKLFLIALLLDINVGLHLIHDHHTIVSEFQKIVFNCICLDIFRWRGFPLY